MFGLQLSKSVVDDIFCSNVISDSNTQVENSDTLSNDVYDFKFTSS